MRNGPILLIDDDEDDQFLVRKMIAELEVPNRIQFFGNGQQLLDYLYQTSEQPFIILCDINMPIMDGLELRRNIDASPFLQNKSIPFVFLTTDASRGLVNAAYKATIQGFFRKETGYAAAKEQLRWIIGYWQHCLHPHNLPGDQ